MKSKTTSIPAWVQEIRLIHNGIDGYPPSEMPDSMDVSEFLKKAKVLQNLEGGGEWDDLIYGIEYTGSPSTIYHPYGQQNPYRRLRSDGTCRVVYLGMFSYMHWPVKFRRDVLLK